MGAYPFPHARSLPAPTRRPTGGRASSLEFYMHTACVRKGVCARACARACKDRSWGHLQLSRIRFRSPPREVGQARSFFPGTWSLGRTNECPHSHALWVYPAGKERGLQRAPPAARSLQYPARLQGAGVSQFTSCAGAGMSCCCAASARWGEFVVRSL